MVAGHLQEKNGYFYAVLSYKDNNNKRKTKWIPTGQSVKGNKKKATAFLLEQLMTLFAILIVLLFCRSYPQHRSDVGHHLILLILLQQFIFSNFIMSIKLVFN